MSLRARLGITLALMVVPFTVGVTLLLLGSQRRTMEDTLAETAIARMQSGERAVCEAAPEIWPRLGGRTPGGAAGLARPRGARQGHRRLRGPRTRHAPRDVGRVFAYDAKLRSDNPSAPAFPARLSEELRSGADVATRWHDRGATVAVRMPWREGPCAVLLVEYRRAGPNLLRGIAHALALSLIAVLMAVMAAGPIVRRIRRLTEHLRRRTQDEPIPVQGKDEIAELASAFEANRQEIAAHVRSLEERDAALTRYMANTTHDVMLPLTVLQGHLTAMREQLERGTPASLELVDAALEQSHYMVSLVHNLSAATKLDAGEPQLERHPVDLCALTDRVRARHAPIARNKGVELNHAAPEDAIFADADPILLEQAVGNLVHNAVRYNHMGGHVALILESPEAGSFRIRVLDDGPGIPDEELSRVAERRFRGGEARRRHTHGLGLGLHIVRDVCKRHGYELDFERPSKGGLEVRITGPVTDASPR